MHIEQVFVTGLLINKKARKLAAGMTFDIAADLADPTGKAIELRVVVSEFTKPDTYCVVVCDEKRAVVQESAAIEITETHIENKQTTAVVTITLEPEQVKRGQLRVLRVTDLVERLNRPLIADPTDDELAPDTLPEDLRAALGEDLDVLHKDEALMARVAEARQDEVAWLEVASVLKDFNLLRSVAKRVATWTPADPPLVALDEPQPEPQEA